MTALAYLLVSLGVVAVIVWVWIRIVDVAFVDHEVEVTPTPPRRPAKPCRWCGTEPRQPVPPEYENVLALFPVPDCDCEERAHCEKAGVPGHYSCGWCDEHEQPVHVCHNEGRFEHCGAHRRNVSTSTTEGGEHR